MISECIKHVGEVEIIIDYIDGKQDRSLVKNVVLRTAKEAHIQGIVNNIGSSWEFFVDRMIFGTNGAIGGVPKVVEDSRNGLFGVTLLSKSTVGSINESAPTQAIFTTVVAFSEGNGYTITEMALQMANGDLYSMITHPGISKTSAAQITFNWRVSMI